MRSARLVMSRVRGTRGGRGEVGKKDMDEDEDEDEEHGKYQKHLSRNKEKWTETNYTTRHRCKQ